MLFADFQFDFKQLHNKELRKTVPYYVIFVHKNSIAPKTER